MTNHKDNYPTDISFPYDLYKDIGKAHKEHIEKCDTKFKEKLLELWYDFFIEEDHDVAEAYRESFGID